MCECECSAAYESMNHVLRATKVFIMVVGHNPKLKNAEKFAQISNILKTNLHFQAFFIFILQNCAHTVNLKGN